MRAFAGLLIRSFFRSVEVENRDALPIGAPAMVVASHRNGLVDGLLLMVALRRYPRFLGKSTLFKIPPLWPLLKLAGVVPVYRAADGPSTDKNTSTFAASRRILGDGGLIAVFPEGISHDAPRLQTLRTGAARIALGATVEDNLEDLVLVPIGISYDAKARFRSRALVRVGEPVPVNTWAPLYREDQHQAVRTMTDDIAARLRNVGPDYRSWTEAADLSMVAEIVLRPLGTRQPEPVGLGRREELARLQAASAESAGDGALDPVRQALARYQQELWLLGLDDGQVASSAGRQRHGVALGWAIVKAIAAVPVAVVGTAVHILPYEVVKRLARVPGNEGMRATVKLAGCLVSFSVIYGVIGWIVGARFGIPAGLAASAAGPLSGYVTVLFFERLRRIGGLVEVLHLARGRRTTLTSLLASRAAVVAAADRLISAPAVRDP
jgi:1-acyl-sn-glycerol-3-phosphate acyltransferase